ncbi:RIP metalloprotease RseP [Clostridium fermenticellae]|uniref:Zinc metalloprotease n=1 Tax=Clostridium fermenticellae TaxID=2068654 RepID=A0A386H3J6_9CLOT|nr:RIP metalloprotease RseP [Clostridium fermenticellae]AYD40065.1 RIP metalloprotease RseP [Clostridium fermenticellae]
MYIIAAIIAFGLLILIHELGHFTLAKLNGVKVEEFAIGMGPKLFSINGKETVYSIRILPIGGYVKMLGEESESNDPRAFNNKTAWQKLSIVTAGPVMNILLGVLLFAIIASARGYVSSTVDKVVQNQPAAIMGLKSGDRIVKVNNSKVALGDDFVTELYTNGAKSVNVTYIRGGKEQNIKITPIRDKSENRYVVGIYFKTIENATFGQSVKYGLDETRSLIKQTFAFFKILFAGRASMNDFGGPVTIIKLSGAAARAGILSLIAFAAYITLQLGIFNLLPIPALDGGYILLFIFEIITGKKVSDNKVGVINYIGFALLMTIMVLVTIKDIFYPIKI